MNTLASREGRRCEAERRLTVGLFLDPKLAAGTFFSSNLSDPPPPPFQLGTETGMSQIVLPADQDRHSPGITPLFWIKSRRPQGEFSTDGRLPPRR